MYQYTDGGRATSKRPKQTGDCTVRAIALTCGMAYDDAYDMLKKAGRKASQGFDINSFIRRRKLINNKRLIWTSYPAVKGKKRMNTRQFIEEHPRGTYILSQANHVSVVINGINYDLFESWERCVYGVWKIY